LCVGFSEDYAASPDGIMRVKLDKQVKHVAVVDLFATELSHYQYTLSLYDVARLSVCLSHGWII